MRGDSCFPPSDDLRHRYFREPEARVFRPLLFEKLYNVFCGVYLRLVMSKSPFLDAGTTGDADLEFQRCHEKFRFCTEVYLSMSFILCLKQIENKQPVQTSFRCVLWRQQFGLAEAVVTFFWCQKTLNLRCMCNRTFFVSKGEGSKRARLGSSRNQTAQETSLSTLFPSVRWSKSWTWERRTVCLSGCF